MSRPSPDFLRSLQAAMTLHQTGKLAEAARAYQTLINLHTDQPDPYQLLAVLARQMGNAGTARQLLDAALRLAPDHVPALTNQALLALESGAVALAETSARRAVALAPKNADAQQALGSVLQAQRRFAEAAACYRLALKDLSQQPMLWNSLAGCLRRLGDLTGAWAAARRARDLGPDRAMIHNSCGNILRAAGYGDLAAEAFDRAMALAPHDDDIAVNAGIAHLVNGDMARGWPLFRRRRDYAQHLAHLPLWDGVADPLVQLVLYAEQGLGDTLQYAALIPAAATRVGRVTIQLQPPLRALLAASFPAFEIHEAPTSPPPTATHRLRLMDLPALFDMVPTAPWLCFDAARAAAWTARLESHPHPRIGLVWAGNPQHLNDANRSLDFTIAEKLAAALGAHGVSLQRDHGGRMPGGLRDLGPELADFTDTAALIGALDLIITVDTAVAHLAGALGKPVWMLTPFDPDWRWGWRGNGVAWYPSMRLYRQPQPRDWDTVVAQLRDDLERMLAGKTLTPPTLATASCRAPLVVALPL